MGKHYCWLAMNSKRCMGELWFANQHKKSLLRWGLVTRSSGMHYMYEETIVYRWCSREIGTGKNMRDGLMAVGRR